MKRLRPLAFEMAVIGLVLGLGGAVGLVREGSEQGYRVLEEDLSSIRAAFNAEVGSVRAVLLASPT